MQTLENPDRRPKEAAKWKHLGALGGKSFPTVQAPIGEGIVSPVVGRKTTEQQEGETFPPRTDPRHNAFVLAEGKNGLGHNATPQES